jgi:hypothetical protein
VNVLCVYFLVFGRNIDLEITISLPFLFVEFYFGNFLTEDGVTDDAPKESVADVLVLLVLVHEVAQEDGEVDDVEEERLHRHLKHLLLKPTLLVKIHFVIRLQQLVRSQRKITLVSLVVQLVLQDHKTVSYQEI